MLIDTYAVSLLNKASTAFRRLGIKMLNLSYILYTYDKAV
ncbi:hypothetical protein l13_03500 [Neisseria weaveri ATCC 51223]|nr:hypothetical protein l13_03500 [Neisseria weaveri ATCC 51223]